MYESMCRILVGFVLLMGSAIPLAGQANAGQASGTCPVTPTKVQRQVYTAELKTTSVQKLADGTTITQESKRLYAQDSQGRSLYTNTNGVGNPSQATWIMTSVNDPVERTQTTWNSQNKNAVVTKLPPADQQQGCWADKEGHFRMTFGTPSTRVLATAKTDSKVAPSSFVINSPQQPPHARSIEDLGIATIMGIEAHGQRMTQTTPVGEIGNDRPLVHTDEFWSAPRFGFFLRQVDSDPQNGTQTTEVVSLDQSEPPLSTFQPPEGYEVAVEELHEVACQQTVP